MRSSTFRRREERNVRKGIPQAVKAVKNKLGRKDETILVIEEWVVHLSPKARML